ncbi:histidine kinase [Rhodopseudomonas palustris]|uniref:histidine kinase n=1 Tax=Rhodopseudomonas palustris TaxID=1076 RepID=A0A323UHF0_RHOPL|nr:histidine kinase dimerization/phosphoacceptor domain -containing protein [Rhodopseudomonas palustris]PZA12245.1 histidine kinase [Rhodopseudomonas palustris]
MSADDGQVPPQGVDQILGSPRLVAAIESDRYKHLLDNVPVAIAVSQGFGEDQRVVYINQAFEALTLLSKAEVYGHGWSCLDGFADQDDAGRTLGAAIRDGEEFVGVFRQAALSDRLLIVQAYVAAIESDDGIENYRIAALVDVGGRERAQIERFESQIRERDTLMRELQHRVKNNLQLITALVRLEARSAAEGETVALARLASRIDALTVLYRVLSDDNTSVDGGQIDLGQYLSDIADAVIHANAASGVNCEVSACYCPLSVNVAMPAGLLVNEMLTNALKYAFVGRSAGRIKVVCSAEAGRVSVVVSDDGVGLAEGQQWPSPRKLGALILQTLKENASNVCFEVKTIRGQGTWFTLTFEAASALAPN